MDWLKAYEARFSRKDLGDGDFDRQREEIDFCTRQLFTNYELGSPDMIAEPPKHRTCLARIRLAIPSIASIGEASGPQGHGASCYCLSKSEVDRGC